VIVQCVILTQAVCRGFLTIAVSLTRTSAIDWGLVKECSNFFDGV
jgi:hypothetical protein